MERAGVRTRDIRFWSNKNNSMICVHNRWAKDFAKNLEEWSWVESYEVCVPLNSNHFPHISPVDIRSGYFSEIWTSDFLIHCTDGRKEIRELVQVEQLKRRATIEKLELSRRYWATVDTDSWKIVLIGGREHEK